MAPPAPPMARGPRGGMPSRRTFELILVVGMLGRPVLGGIRLWAIKTMGNTQPGTFLHVTAEVLSILT